jgi:serine/threonine protein kinase/Tol biopolymer transport system component
MAEGGGSQRKPGPDTSGALAIARTVPSEARIDTVASADTLLAVPPAEPSTPSQRGETLGGRYRVLAEVGRGAEGVVYRARDLKADTLVALKLFQHDEGSDERLQRFRRELQMARKVTHANVVRIYDLVELPGRFGLSMELIDGEALDERIARGKLGRDELVRLAVDLARALAAAHEAGVTHRDLKPANVLLRARDGHAVVTDFGVSRAHADTDARVSSQPDPARGPKPLSMTLEGALIGTPLYMAPEQLQGHADIGPPADVYAFGAVLFEAATGKPPHDGDTVLALLDRKTSTPAPPLRDARPDLPRVLCDAVDRSLRRVAGERFASGAELLAALEPLASPARKVRGVPAGWLGVGLIAIVGGGAGVYYVARRPHVVPAAPPPSSPATPPLALAVSNARRITFGEACEEFPSFTPDGRAVLYDGTVGRDSFVYRLDVTPGATPRQITHVRGWDIAARASPDGASLAFLRLEGERVGAFVGPLDGHEPPHMVVKGGMRPSWTRDGTAIWAGAGAPIAAYDVVSGAVTRAVSESPTVKTALTAELSSGQLLTVFPSHGASDSNVGGVAILSPTEPPRWLFKQPVQEALTATADGRHAIVSRTTPTGVELLDLPVDGSPPVSLAAAGIEAREGVSLSRDGKSIVWSSCKEVPQLVAIDPRDRTLRTIRPDMAGPTSIARVPDRPEIVVVSTRAGKAEPWVVPLAGDGAPRALGIGALTAAEVAVSHDGKRFVVSVPNHGLELGSTDGTALLRRLTTSGTDAAPAFRAGDAQVVFTRRTAGRPQIMSVPVDGGEPSDLMGSGSDGAAPSPVDDRIAYLAGSNETEYVPTLWDGHAGKLRALSPKLPAGRYGYLSFSPDGRRVVMVRGQTELVEVDVTTGAIVRTFATPMDDQLGVPVYAPSGLVAVRVRWQGNVWMADLGNEPR